jgi:hypothetical protein
MTEDVRPHRAGHGTGRVPARCGHTEAAEPPARVVGHIVEKIAMTENVLKLLSERRKRLVPVGFKVIVNRLKCLQPHGEPVVDQTV